jgi:hypothetical protein
MALLEDGVDVVIASDLSSIISLLDKEVRSFSCEGHGYSLTPGKGTVGTRWQMMVRTVNLAGNKAAPRPVGRIELEKQEDGSVQFKIPPRAEQKVPEAQETDPDGRLFGSFIYQTINVLKRRQLIDLPGELPTE